MRKQRWASWELTLIRDLYREGISEKEIARQLGRSLFSVSKKIDQSGLRVYKQDRKRSREENKRKRETTSLQSHNFQEKLTRRVDELIQSELKPLANFSMDHHEANQQENDDYLMPIVTTEREKVAFQRSKEMFIHLIIDEFRETGHCVRIASHDEKLKSIFRGRNEWGETKNQQFYLLDGKHFLTEGQLLLRYNIMREGMGKSILRFPETDE